MMSKFAYGPASGHILSSEGPSRNDLRFYSTTYSTNYRSGTGVEEEEGRKSTGKPIHSLRHK